MPWPAIRSAASPSSPSTTPTGPPGLRERLPAVPIVGLLEGGYVPARLADGVVAHLRALGLTSACCLSRGRPYNPAGSSGHRLSASRTPCPIPCGWMSSCSSCVPSIPFIIARGARATTAPSGSDSPTAMGRKAGARRRRASSTARRLSRCWPRSRLYGTALPDDPLNLEEAERRWETMLRGNAAARAALSAALHDLAGKRLGVPVYRMWGLDPCKAPKSTFTIGLDSPERIRAKVLEAEQYPILKVKLGTDRDCRDPAGHSGAQPTRRSG